MVKQKVEIKLVMENAKKRTKALKAAAGMDGIISTSVDGDKIVVVGDGLDPVSLTTVLRKKLGTHADLITVASGDEKKEEKENKSEGEAKSLQPVIWPYHYTVAPPYPYQYPCYEVDQYPNSCSIM